MNIDKIRFAHICDISPEMSPNGSIQEYMPQARYENRNNLPLNKYGEGPYCKFKIPRIHNQCGVYALVVGGVVKYVGECVDLSSRYNMGYGNISPRNCFVGGQETNCRLNNLIFLSAKNGLKISLWLHQTENHKEIEGDLRLNNKYDWNRI